MFFLTASFTLIFSLMTSSIFNKSILFFLSYLALIVFNIEILSLLKAISSFNILILTVMEVLILLPFYIKKKKFFPDINFNFFEILNALKEDKTLLISSLALLFMLSVNFFLVLFSPVSEADAASYHCLRPLFWVSDNFISHFEITDGRCHYMPINSEIIYTWIFSLLRKDTLFGLLQFFSYFLLIFSTFSVMNFFNIHIKNRIWAIILFSSFPCVIIQISSTQTDLLVGALYVLSLNLLLEFKKDTKISNLFFSSLSIAIALGVKSTAYILFIPVIIFYFYLLKKDFFKYILFLIFNFFIFSSYNLVLNFISYGNLFSSTSGYLTHSLWGGFPAVVSNFIRYFFNFIDFSGLEIAKILQHFVFYIQDFVLKILHIDLNLSVIFPRNVIPNRMTEQIAGFSVLGFLVFLPCLFLGFFKKNLRAFSIIFFVSVLVLSFTLAYMIFSIRFFVTFVAFAIPLLSLSYFEKLNFYKFICLFFILRYLIFSTPVLSERPFVYYINQFLSNKTLSQIQDDLRVHKNTSAEFQKYNQRRYMEDAIKPFCHRGNKIGVFLSYSEMFENVKYLEFNNNCKIYAVNPLHSFDENFFDVVVVPSFEQEIDAIKIKDDISDELSDNLASCSFYFSKYIPSFKKNTGSKNSLIKCKIHQEYFSDLGYKLSSSFSYIKPEFDNDTKQDIERRYMIWSK